MAKAALSDRLAALEREVAALRELVTGNQAKDWRAVEHLMLSPGMAAIGEEAMKIRERDRAKVRRRPARVSK